MEDYKEANQLKKSITLILLSLFLITIIINSGISTQTNLYKKNANNRIYLGYASIWGNGNQSTLEATVENNIRIKTESTTEIVDFYIEYDIVCESLTDEGIITLTLLLDGENLTSNITQTPLIKNGSLFLRDIEITRGDSLSFIINVFYGNLIPLYYNETQAVGVAVVNKELQLTNQNKIKTLYITEDICIIPNANYQSQTQYEYSYIDRDRIIEIAEEYLNHEWYPTEENIFHDEYKGWPIDTPDRDTYTEAPNNWGWKANQMNKAIPYKWGGFSSISGLNLTNPEDFDEQYTGTGAYNGTIHYGGDIYTDKNYVCPKACGVDCSGFVSRCWNLPEKHGTYTLPYTSSLVKLDELQKGDVLNIPRYHVILFIEFVNDEKTLIRTIECGGSLPNVNEQIYRILSVSPDSFYVTLDGYPLDREFGLYRYDLITNTPSPPIIEGPTNGKINQEYSYRISSTDPEYDEIYYCINWGEGTSEGWLGPYPSGKEISINHTWANEGTYEIRAKTKDTNDQQSGWSDPITVNMPKNKETQFYFHSWIRQRWSSIMRFLMF